MKVKLTKINKAENPRHKTPDKKDYKFGEINRDVSVPLDYWLIGELVGDITVGKGIVIAREIRNGVKVEGLYRSSRVKKIDGDTIETDNSIYKIEYLKEEK